MFCPRCAEQLDTTERFCPRCGNDMAGLARGAEPSEDEVARCIKEWEMAECNRRFIGCLLDEQEIHSIARAVLARWSLTPRTP